MKSIKRIAITGPESTGKSQLSKQLADIFKTLWVPEFAREYLDQINKPYNYQDILIISKQQFINENEMAKKAENFIFCDTDFTVTKIWCEFKFNKCFSWINQKFYNHKYDFYLLCNIDLPWEFDPQRENPDEREILFKIYLNTLLKANFPFAVVNGIGIERTLNAVKIIKSIFDVK